MIRELFACACTAIFLMWVGFIAYAAHSGHTRVAEPIPDVVGELATVAVRAASVVHRHEAMLGAARRAQVAEVQVLAAVTPAAKRIAWAHLLDARAAMRVLVSESTANVDRSAGLETLSARLPRVTHVDSRPPARAAAALAASAPAAASISDNDNERMRKPTSGAGIEVLDRQTNIDPPGARPDQTGRAGPFCGGSR